MPLTAPTSANDYQVTPQHALSDGLWNPVFAELQARLNAAELAIAGFQNAVSDAAIATAQGLLADAVAPQIVSVQSDLAALETAIGLAEDALAALTAGGIIGTGVTIAAYAPLLPDATTAQGSAQILADAIVAETTARQAAIEAIVTDPVIFIDLTVETAALVAGKQYRLRRTTAGTYTLPVTPADGDSIRIVDSGVITGAVTHTIARNGETIMSTAEDLVLDTTGIDLTIWFDGTTWRLA